MASRRDRDPRFGPDDVRLGYVSGVHGTRGEVKLFLYNPSSDLLGETVDLLLVPPDGERVGVRLHLRPGAGRRILGQIKGVSDREHARELQGWELVVPADALPEPDEGEWYHRDLVGLPVRTRSGRDLGRIHQIHATGEVDVWVLRGPGGERYLPALASNLVSVRTRAQAGPDEAGVVVTDDAVDEAPPL